MAILHIFYCTKRVPIGACALSSFPTSWDFCYLIIFVSSFNPDQARHFVGPDLGPSCLTLMVIPKEFFEKLILTSTQNFDTYHISK